MWFMVTVAQLVEPRIVTPVVGGSNPLSHPILKASGTPRRLFRMCLRVPLSDDRAAM